MTISLALSTAMPAQGEVQPEETLHPDGDWESGFDFFGHRIAFSEGTLLVGYSTHGPFPVFDGQSVIGYEKSGNAWKESLRVTLPFPGMAPGGLSIDDNWLAIGAPFWEVGGVDCGVARLFRRTGATWEFFRTISPTPCSSGATFGSKISLRGNRLAVLSDDSLVRIYEFDGMNWSLRGSVTGGGMGEEFIWGISLSDDWLALRTDSTVHIYEAADALQNPLVLDVCRVGDMNVEDTRIVIGCGGDGIAVGHVSVLELVNGSWIETGTLQPSNGTGSEDGFGDSIAVAGNQILVGSPNWGREDPNLDELGAAYLFTQISGAWVLTGFYPGELAGVAATSLHGFSVAFGDDVLVVGSPGYDRIGRVVIYPLPSGRFDDDETSLFEGAIDWLAAEGITAGCNPPLNTSFCPDRFVTRGEMAAFLVRALGYTDDGGGDLFVDDDDSVFESAIDKLRTAGVTLGCNPPTNDRYCPDRLVTRGEMAAFLVRAFGYTDAGTRDYFVDDDENIFEDAIDKLRVAGVTLGCNPPANDRYCPDDDVTRGQMAAFLKRSVTG